MRAGACQKKEGGKEVLSESVAKFFMDAKLIQ